MKTKIEKPENVQKQWHWQNLKKKMYKANNTRLDPNHEINFFFSVFRPFAIMFVLVIEAPIPNLMKVF